LSRTPVWIRYNYNWFFTHYFEVFGFVSDGGLFGNFETPFSKGKLFGDELL